MKYKITIPQIHCSGCANLIKIIFEDYFSEINVDLQNKSTTFESNEDIEKTKLLLDKIFKSELEPAEYKYIDLVNITN